jgi:DNA-binding SARP family transcriptional activator
MNNRSNSDGYLMLTAKVVVPLPEFELIHRSMIERLEKYPLTLVNASPGYILTDSLAAGLFERKWPVTWCRLAWEDGDPGFLLLSLIGALRQLAPEVGQATIKRMRQQPGPVNGWPQLFASLANEADGLLPLPCWLVFENIHHLQDHCACLELLLAHFLSLLPEGVHAVLLAPASLQCKAVTARIPTISENDLRLDAYTAQTIIADRIPDISTNDTLRLIQLFKGQAAYIMAVLAAVRVLSTSRFEQILRKSTSGDDLLSQIARACLLPLNSRAIEALTVSQHLEYSHPRIDEAVLGGYETPDGPWWQPLEDRWMYLRPVWRRPLKLALRSAAPGHAALARAASFYLAQKMPEKSVPLYIEIGELSKAAEVMDHVADRMMDLGQWDLLRSWINRLPAPVLHQWPWLVYAGSEMIASGGNLNAARRAFGKTSSLFKERQELPGICQSLLAECALAVQASDWVGAATFAQEALDWAENGALHWYIVWASWALGYFSLRSELFTDAQVCFLKANESAAALANPELIHLTEMIATLLTARHGFNEESEYHRLAYLELESKEKAVIHQIHYLIQDTHGYVNGLLEKSGWSNVPLTLKLPIDPVQTQPVLPSPPAYSGLKQLLQGLLSIFSLPARAPKETPDALEPFVLKLAENKEEPVALEEGSVPKSCYSITPQSITVYLLGSFRIVLQDRVVQHWPKGRGRSLFKYLLVNRDRFTPREVLMDIFWPDTPPDAARNRLNVALYGIRKILSEASDHLIIFKDGAYQLNPENIYWVDTDEFTCQYQEGYRFDEGQHVENAIAAYEACVSLYHGDYLEDEPYEEWPVLTREKLRIMYLSVLDRLSEIYLGQSQFSRCIDLCQHILERDNCREDAYGRLMRCYASQDQIPLAMRQYQVCVETLRNELDVEPSPAIRRLYERIQRREKV